MRADGEPTYFAADIAYHRDKLERGAERMIDPVGADHHGYVPRMRAAIEALGHDPDLYEAPIMQFVRLVEGGERARMSKRRGEFAALDDLIDDIGVDAARFFMLHRSHDTALDLDLELARSQSQDNPVYYVQYAHGSRASSARPLPRAALRLGSMKAWPTRRRWSKRPRRVARSRRRPSSRACARPAAARASAEAGGAAERRAPHRLVAFATASAAQFHAFYRDCQVVGAPDGIEQARLALCVAAKRVIARTLGLLGVSAPERM